MVATLVLCGSPDPDAILAAFFSRADAQEAVYKQN